MIILKQKQAAAVNILSQCYALLQEMVGNNLKYVISTRLAEGYNGARHINTRNLEVILYIEPLNCFCSLAAVYGHKV